MFNTSRRHYLRSFLADIFSAAEELSGVPQYRTNELEAVPDDKFHNMVPVLDSRRTLRIEDGWILIRDARTEEFRKYYHFRNHEEFIFCRFDGNHSIIGICNLLEFEFALTKEEAYAQTRSIFIHLAHAGLCYPAGGHE